MAKDFLKSDPIEDFEQIFNQDFNKLIRKVHKGLSTKKRSPVYTGFFASSWKAQTMGVCYLEKLSVIASRGVGPISTIFQSDQHHIHPFTVEEFHRTFQ